MYTPKGFKGELAALFDSLDELVKGTLSNTKERSSYTASQQINGFFNNLDYSLYNQEKIKEIKKGIDEVLPKYIEATYGMYAEEPKVNESMNKLFGVFTLSGVAIGLQTVILAHYLAPALAPVGFFTGFWGGIYLTDVVDGMINKKYEYFKNTKNTLREKCLSLIN